MNDIENHLLSVFFGFFAIMNPLANTAVFVGLTSNQDDAGRRRTAIKSLTLTFGLITIFAILGKILFQFFGITLPALRIAGGILVFVIGYHMVQGQSSTLHHAEDDTESDIAVSPLAVPILAGPGTIATTMNFTATESHLKALLTVAVFGVLCLITFACFVSGQRILGRLGANGVDVITRLMGLILAVIGVQMFATGVHGAIAAYKALAPTG